MATTVQLDTATLTNDGTRTAKLANDGTRTAKLANDGTRTATLLPAAVTATLV